MSFTKKNKNRKEIRTETQTKYFYKMETNVEIEMINNKRKDGEDPENDKIVKKNTHDKHNEKTIQNQYNKMLLDISDEDRIISDTITSGKLPLYATYYDFENNSNEYNGNNIFHFLCLCKSNYRSDNIISDIIRHLLPDHKVILLQHNINRKTPLQLAIDNGTFTPIFHKLFNNDERIISDMIRYAIEQDDVTLLAYIVDYMKIDTLYELQIDILNKVKAALSKLNLSIEYDDSDEHVNIIQYVIQRDAVECYKYFASLYDLYIDKYIEMHRTDIYLYIWMFKYNSQSILEYIFEDKSDAYILQCLKNSNNNFMYVCLVYDNAYIFDKIIKAEVSLFDKNIIMCVILNLSYECFALMVKNHFKEENKPFLKVYSPCICTQYIVYIILANEGVLHNIVDSLPEFSDVPFGTEIDIFHRTLKMICIIEEYNISFFIQKKEESICNIFELQGMSDSVSIIRERGKYIRDKHNDNTN